MQQVRLPYEISRVEKSLVPVQAMMMISPQIIRSDGPSWFVENPPSWSVPPIMGRVNAQPLKCAIVGEILESPCRRGSIISSPPIIPRPSEDDSESSIVSEDHLCMIPQTHMKDSE